MSEMTLAETLAAIQRCDPSIVGNIYPDADEPAQYAFRNSLVYRALALAAASGMPCGVGPDPKEPDYLVVYIDLPDVGQVSWHVPAYRYGWDGHTHDDKTARINAYAR